MDTLGRVATIMVYAAFVGGSFVYFVRQSKEDDLSGLVFLMSLFWPIWLPLIVMANYVDSWYEKDTTDSEIDKGS